MKLLNKMTIAHGADTGGNMAWKGGDPFPTIPNVEKPGLGIGDKVVNFVKGKLKGAAPAPTMNAQQAQRAADLSAVSPSQRPEMNDILNTTDNTDLKIK